MRYAKGSFVISPQHDVPLLLQVRNSRFITHQQLFALMQFGGHEYSRNTFKWRVARLREFGCISACENTFGNGKRVYTIAQEGLLHLENHGHFASVLNSTTEHLPHPSQAHHALELNAIHLALIDSKALVRWQSDVEIASENTIADSPLAKDYDAIVDVWNGDNMARFALEYERTLKSARQYDKVRKALEAEDRIGCILYLTSGPQITRHLAREFSGIPKRLAFAAAPVFRRHLLDTTVICESTQSAVPFRQLLRGVFSL
jgi:hypothetical protein